MFVLVINPLILISDAVVLQASINFCFVTFFYLHTSHYLQYYLFENLPWEFDVRICRSYLPQEFIVRTCRGNLLWIFTVKICHGYLSWVFCICKQNLFLYVSKSCLYGTKPFLFVRFSLLTVFIYVIVVAIMGHHF